MAKIERKGEKVMKKASTGLKKIQLMNFPIPRLGSDSDSFQKNFRVKEALKLTHDDNMVIKHAGFFFYSFFFKT